MSTHRIICGHVLDVLRNMPSEHVDMLMTSVPYWGLRDYGEDTATIWGGDKGCEHSWIEQKSGLIHENRNNLSGTQEEVVGKSGTAYIKKYDDKKADFCSLCGAWHGQLGLESTPELYIEHLSAVFAEVKRVLKKSGTCWVNIGDTYGGTKTGNTNASTNGIGKPKFSGEETMTFTKSGGTPKCMCMIPERFAFAMLDLGFILRNKIVWHKPNPMPSSVKDRFNTTYEMLFLFSKSQKYWFDLDTVREEHKESSIQRNNYQWNSKQRTHSPNEKRGGDNREAGKLFQSSGKNPGDCWTINTQSFPDAHFAVFPEKLCEKPILAGCPVEVCSVCGKARVRITETNLIPIRETNDKGKVKEVLNANDRRNVLPRSRTGIDGYNEIKTIGWTSCSCQQKDKYEPGVVLDIFAGSGTVGVVAEKLNRSSILIDIKTDYCEMAYNRIEELAAQTTLSGKRSTVMREGF